MKKIININLSGRVIPIEDTAYEKLQAYIESLRRYFINEEGRDEIINDIESRIAELMNEKIRKGASAITDADVDEIAASMGRPEDFEAEIADETTTGQSQQESGESHTYAKRPRGRLYRDRNDKFIGGVCAGLANYLNVDPAMVRILFALFILGGGLGLLLYILLWIFLPEAPLEEYSGKRLYRNPDDRIIGGVAGGLAAYFNIKPSTLRIIFAAPLVFSIFLGFIRGFTWHYDFDFVPNIFFGSISGTFILAYIILWAVIPEARSPYEKMEMRGEKVDVNTIRQNMKERMKEWGDEVKESAQKMGSRAKEFANTKGKAFASEVGETARRGGRGLGHAIGVLFKVFFLFIAGTIAFGLFVAVIAMIFGGIAWWPINNFLWTSNWQQAYAWGTLIFFLFVPLVAFITWIIRRMIRVRSRSGYLGWTFGGLWVIGWVCAVLFSVSMSRDFSVYDNHLTTIETAQPANNRMIVVVSEPELSYTGRFSWIDADSEGWDLTDDTARLSSVRFNIRKSADDQYHVLLRKYSFGRTEDEALDRAEKIQYHLTSKDSVLDLGSGYAFDKGSKFRGQNVEIEILVPVGKKIRFDRSVKDKLNPADFRVNRRYRRNRVVDIQFDNYYRFRYRSDVDYVMGIDGYLKDPAGVTINNGGSYRYNEVNNDSASIQRQIETEKRRREEIDQNIKELEKKQKEVKSSTGSIRVDEKQYEGAMAKSPSLVFSHVRSYL